MDIHKIISIKRSFGTDYVVSFHFTRVGLKIN